MTHAEYIQILKDSYRRRGFNGLGELEKTDLLLSYAARADMRDATSKLHDEAGPHALFVSSKPRLADEYGLPPSAAIFPQIILACISRALSETSPGKLLSDEDLGQMLVYKYLGVRVETVYLTLFDADRRYIDCVMINEGSVNDTMVASRKLLEQAIMRKARYAAISHNHPSGEAEPSKADEHTTRLLAQTFSYAGIEFIGHYIVAGKNYVTIK